ncbi:MAG: RNA methyltransferase [Bacteroidales bacterium]|nr:RNA methyltransferase [Bacteroidales bacterium]
MISKAQIKLIQSLKSKKYRKKNGLFVVEGIKLVKDLLSSGFKPVHIFAVRDFINDFVRQNCPVDELSRSEMKKISFLTTPSETLALFKIPEYPIHSTFKDDFILVLDNVQDPGNLGTIIRVADWFGIKNIVCSENTADIYNPKVVQASMGSIARVKVHYTTLFNYLKEASNTYNFTLYGSFMKGESIYDRNFSDKKVLIMGNEGQGISKEIKSIIDEEIAIPPFFKENKGPESLNVAMATGIILSEIRRKN